MTIEITEVIAGVLIRSDLVRAKGMPWLFDDDSPDWERVRYDIAHGLVDGWSSGEQRVVRGALALHDVDLWALNPAIQGDLAAELRRAAEELEAQAAEGRDWLAGMLSRGWVQAPAEGAEVPPL